MGSAPSKGTGTGTGSTHRPPPPPYNTAAAAAAATTTMPSFFSFQQGSEDRSYPPADTSPLLGRFRAVPRPAPSFGGPGPILGGHSANPRLGGGGGGRQQGHNNNNNNNNNNNDNNARDGVIPVFGGRRGARRGGGNGNGTNGNDTNRGSYRTASLLSAGYRGSVHVGYGALIAARQLEAEAAEEEEEQERRRRHGGAGGEDDDEDEDGEESESRAVEVVRRLWKVVRDTWVTPRAGAVRRVVDSWWSRWLALVVLPAALAVAWCAVPFPQYPLPGGDGDGDGDGGSGGAESKVPGHGAARVRVNFWFFLFVYYGFYNLTALIWITKVFNLYSLNWWPQSLGFPVTVSAIAVFSLAAPIPVYLIRETNFLTVYNVVWIAWTFVIMAMPVAIAFFILMTNERHLGLRHSLTETQRIFTSSWWTGEPESTLSRREASRRRHPVGIGGVAFDPLNSIGGGGVGGAAARGLSGVDMVDDSSPLFAPAGPPSVPVRLRLRRRWLPASFVRFVWFCLALFIGLLAYLIGETYAEIYLQTLPHDTLETIVYVYGWISTVYLLDGLTGWILGGNEGERVGSYPLSWTFKLYFMLTYQTYVRALYARLRSPSQFILLQVLSSSGLIIVTPLLMSSPVHWLATVVGLNAQSYGSYQKTCVRNVFIRFLAENVSMLAFLASVVVLHFGANKDVYPYFAFDASPTSGTGDGGDLYTFGLTFYASSITWACELVASLIVAVLIRFFFGVSVLTEGRLDLVVWPELLPTSVAVMLHVLQNMFFSIIRLQFA